jgi:hypothetical protein
MVSERTRVCVRLTHGSPQVRRARVCAPCRLQALPFPPISPFATSGSPVTMGDTPIPPAEAGMDRERVLAALSRATPLLRARLAEAVDLKVVPALRFVWDAFSMGETPIPSLRADRAT